MTLCPSLFSGLCVLCPTNNNVYISDGLYLHLFYSETLVSFMHFLFNNVQPNSLIPIIWQFQTFLSVFSFLSVLTSFRFHKPASIRLFF
jgi:hypothetical protein